MQESAVPSFKGTDINGDDEVQQEELASLLSEVSGEEKKKAAGRGVAEQRQALAGKKAQRKSEISLGAGAGPQPGCRMVTTAVTPRFALAGIG